MSGEHPYAALPEHAFWRPAVADRHVADFADIWNPPEITRTDRIATAGSCFAQHIGRALRKRGANYLDLEPAPPFLDAAEAKRMGFGLFSCRYGNIYTSRQLVQLIEEAFATTPRPPHIWEKDGRFWDALRPWLSIGIQS